MGCFKWEYADVVRTSLLPGRLCERKRDSFLNFETTSSPTYKPDWNYGVVETEAPAPLNLRPVRLALWTGIGVTFIILCIIILHCRQAQHKWHREKHGNTPPSGISSGETYRPEEVTLHRRNRY